MQTFDTLGLNPLITQAVSEEGYTTPTPIQAQAIPPLLEGRDLLGLAQTGTGKTAAFALPILHRLEANRPPRMMPRSMRVLVLVPTRELAVQVREGFATYGKHIRLRHTVIFGGVGQHAQARAMERGVDVLVATPGRLIDLANQGLVRFDGLEVLVLDEADRMFDMGFVRDIKKIIGWLPKARQTLLFSATMPDAIVDLAHSVLHRHVRVEVTPPATTVERIAQRVLFVERGDKRRLLAQLLDDPSVERAIVFTRTKHGANRLAEQLTEGGIDSDAIHGNKSQNARQKALDAFKAGELRALVATDIAARGIDVDGVTHVFNFDLPNEPESYVHRIGRTARAGREGVAVSLCDLEEVPYLKAIEKAIRQPVPVDEGHDFHAAGIAGAYAGNGRGGSGRPGQNRQPNRGGTQRPRVPMDRQDRPVDERKSQDRPIQDRKPQDRNAQDRTPQGAKPPRHDNRPAPHAVQGGRPAPSAAHASGSSSDQGNLTRGGKAQDYGRGKPSQAAQGPARAGKDRPTWSDGRQDAGTGAKPQRRLTRGGSTQAVHKGSAQKSSRA